MLLSRLKRSQEVGQVIDEMDGWIPTQHGNEASEARQRDEALVEMVRTTYCFDQENWDEGVEHFARALQLDPSQRERLPDTYVRLLVNDRFEEALPLIRRDQPSQVRPNFWLGYVAFRSGEQEKANKLWEKALPKLLKNSECQPTYLLLLNSIYFSPKH